MAEEIIKSLAYLIENLTNLPTVLVHCVQNNIITIDEKENIMAGETSQDRNERFFEKMKIDWEEIQIDIIKILRETTNGHCADQIEGKQLRSVESLSQQILKTEERTTKRILGSKWWPVEKYLPKAFLERKEGETKLVDILKDNLKSKNRSTVINQGAAVSGMGGVGKTTIAKWFALENQDDYDHIIWVDCGDENLSISFNDLAREMKIDPTLRLNLLSKKCFSKLEKAKCLFIFDNAEGYQGLQGIRDVLPKHENFHTIITSRIKEWGSESGDGKIPEMHLNTFSTRDSIGFLKKNLKDKSYTEDQLKELGELLGNLPLALQIAVTTINNRKISITEYNKRIQKTERNIHLNFDDYEKTINKTMKISLDIIKNLEDDPKQTAYNILLIFSYIQPDMVDFKLFQAVENLSEFETEEAMELLEKYSLITIDKNHDCLPTDFEEAKELIVKNAVITRLNQYCSIHRLLQKVIRHNARENEKVITSKILSVAGFRIHKLTAYIYANKETQSRYPEIKGEIVHQNWLNRYLWQRKFIEAWVMSGLIKDILKTPMADYNNAVCLEKCGILTEAESVLEKLYNFLQSETNFSKIDFSFERELKMAKTRIVDNINENGLWNLDVQIEPDLVRGLQFLVYSRLKKDDPAHEIINQDGKLMTFTNAHSLDCVMKYLQSPSIGNYRLENEEYVNELLKNQQKFIFLRIESNYGNKISLKECGLSENFPRDLHYLSLENVEMLDVEGKPLKDYNISTCLSSNLNTLRIKCVESTKFAIQLNDNLPSCHSITLKNCIILLQNGRVITPTEIDLKRISFMKNESEMENVCLNDLVDFNQTKKLNLEGRNMSMKLDERLSIDEISLVNFNGLDLKDLNCSVKELRIENTELPLLDKNVGLRVSKLYLKNCSAQLVSLSFLSQSANEMHLDEVTIEIDEAIMEKKMGLCSADVTLKNIKLIQDSVEMNEINKILELEKIKRLTLLNEKNAKIIFDLNQQFSIDYLKLKRVTLRNFNQSKSSVKTLNMEKISMRNISPKLKVIDTLDIFDSVVDVASLESISTATKKVEIWNTSIHLDANLDPNNPSSKSHLINDQVKEIRLLNNTVFKDGVMVENFLVNEWINISQLNSLNLTTMIYGRGYSNFSLDMENISLSLDTLDLWDVNILNWEKGEGNVNKMTLTGVPFVKRNNIKINTLVIDSSVHRVPSIDLSCLPENIQRLELTGRRNVGSTDQVNFMNLNCVFLKHNHSELEYFSRCPKLNKCELEYYDDDEPLLNLQWIPKSIKKIELKWEIFSFSTPPLNFTGTADPQFKLETLILHKFHVSQTESMLEKLQPKNVFFNLNGLASGNFSLSKTEDEVLIKFIQSCKFVAVGPLKWESDEHFHNCLLSKFVDKIGEVYVFENQRGRVYTDQKSKK